MTVTNFNAGSLAARQIFMPNISIPALTYACWASNETATAKCCTQFGGTRIPLNDSPIAACSFNENPKAWDDCAAEGSTTYICDINGASHSGGSVKGVSSGEVLIASLLLLVQVFTALLLS